MPASNPPGNNSITTAHLANGAVTTDKIADANVTTAKIDDQDVTTAKILDGAITNAKMATDAISTATIVNNAVTLAKIANSAQMRIHILAAYGAPGSDATYDTSLFTPGGGQCISIQFVSGFHNQSGYKGYINSTFQRFSSGGTFEANIDNYFCDHFFNNGGVHMNFAPRVINHGVLATNKQWRFSMAPNTTASGGGTHWDGNDRITVIVIEVPQ